MQNYNTVQQAGREYAVAKAEMNGNLTHRLIRRDSRLPYYAQVMDLLREQFRDAAPHAPLPSENELQDALGVSRTVIRQALQQLVYEGFVYREKGRGTFIAPPKVTQAQFQGLSGLAAEMEKHGEKMETVVLTQRIEPASTQVAEKLEVATASPVVALSRLRYLDSRPLMVAHTWLPADLVPGLDAVDLAAQSLYAILRTRYDLEPADGTRVFEAVRPTDEIAAHLDMEPGAPALLVELTNRTATGRTMEYSIAYHRGDRARFALRVGSVGSV